jgi:hypothetical protein
MPSGVYTRDTMSRDYHGLKRIRMEQRPGAIGTRAVVEATCGECGCPLERTAEAVRLAKREGRKFCCAGCNGLKNSATKRARNQL